MTLTISRKDFRSIVNSDRGASERISDLRFLIARGWTIRLTSGVYLSFDETWRRILTPTPHT